jgi:MFS family permease
MTGSRNIDTQGLLVSEEIHSYESIPSGRSYSNDPEKGDHDNVDAGEEQLEDVEMNLPLWEIACILSTAFAYGCISTTLFLITLPVECERIESQHPKMPKSVALGIFVAVAGVTQLISPLVGMLSDTFRPPVEFELGQRMPYLTLGGIFSVVGLLGQYIESYEKLWLRYGLFFFLQTTGLNISYAMMIALIPDQVRFLSLLVLSSIFKI